MELSGTGIWSAPLRYGDAGQAAEAAAELEELGYTALWIPDVGGDLHCWFPTAHVASKMRAAKKPAQ